MSLKKLIADLKKNTDELNERYPPEKEVTYEEDRERFLEQKEKRRELNDKIEKLPENRIVFPKDFDKAETQFKKLFSGKYHLEFSAHSEKTLTEIQPVLDEVFRISKNLRVGKDVADVEYSVFWTPEEFQKERELTGLSSDDRIIVRSSTYEVNPARVRIGFTGKIHAIEAAVEENRLSLTASGGYRKYLEGLTKALKPEYARLNLSPEDAKKLLERAKERARNGFAGKDSVKKLEEVLKPQLKTVLTLKTSGAIHLENKNVIQANIPTGEMLYYIEDLEKGLLDIPSGQETRITELSKSYGFFRNKKLEDLQKFAGEVQKMDLGIVYDKPLLLNEEAKKLLDMEIDIITKSYTDKHYFGMFGPNTHMVRRPIVKRLAEEHFGNEIAANFDASTLEDFVDFLKAKGYNPVNIANEPDYIEKEMHLFSFLKHSYAKTPDISVERFRDFYKNKKPEIDISAKAKRDASELKSMEIPGKSKLYSFGIVEHMKPATPYSNDLVISRTLVGSRDIHFWCRTSLDSPTLLPLQEYACEQMGIKFR